MKQLNRKQMMGEVLGTFALVFAGTGAIISNDVSRGSVSHVGIAITFGLIILALIYALGDVSGAHFNPAVTLAFWAARRLEWRKVVPYILCQCAGGILASVLLRLMFPRHVTLGATLPSGSNTQSFVLEVVLHDVVDVRHSQRFNGRQGKRHHRRNCHRRSDWAGSDVCRADQRRFDESARSLAPALVAGQLGSLWIYLLAPTLGRTDWSTRVSRHPRAGLLRWQVRCLIIPPTYY
jgi:aquaporin Z